MLTEDPTFTPTRRQWAVMAAALLFLAGALGYALGNRAPSAPSASSVDVGFLQDMIVHHAQAVRMANLVNMNGESEAARVFAREIAQAQSYEIGAMDRQLALWGHSRDRRNAEAMAWMDAAVPVERMPGLAGEAEMTALEQHTGRDSDSLFVALMQDHHRGGVHMAEYAADHASTEYVRSIARSMADAQRLEIQEMSVAQRKAGLDPRPPGYEPDAFPSGETRAADHDQHNWTGPVGRSAA